LFFSMEHMCVLNAHNHLSLSLVGLQFKILVSIFLNSTNVGWKHGQVDSLCSLLQNIINSCKKLWCSSQNKNIILFSYSYENILSFYYFTIEKSHLQVDLNTCTRYAILQNGLQIDEFLKFSNQ
jgi:hypothetical protein